MENNFKFDQYCFFIHRLKQRSILNYKTKLPKLAKDEGNPLIVKLAKEVYDSSELYNTFYFSDTAKNLSEINVQELVDATEGYISTIGGFIGGKYFKPLIQQDNEIIVVEDSSNSNNSLYPTNKEEDEVVVQVEEEEPKEDEIKKEKEEDDEKKQETIEEKPTTSTLKKDDITLGTNIRKNLQYQWSTIFGEERICKSNDALVELAGVVMNLAIWYLGYSEFLISKTNGESVDEEQRKVIYDYLLKAAGIFDWLRSNGSEIRKSITNEATMDFDETVLTALYLQAVGQAQEITIGRAFNKNTSSAAITKLAVDTADIYKEIFTMLQESSGDKIAENRLERLAMFAKYKQQLYLALAYHQTAVDQNQNHQYGAAITTGNHCRTIIKELLANLRPLVSITVSIDSLRRPITALSKTIEIDQTRFERENKVIGFQSIPETVPELPQGNRLAKARPFTLPPLNPTVWDTKSNNLFNNSKKLSLDDISALVVKQPTSSSSSPIITSKKEKNEVDEEDVKVEKKSSNITSPKTQPPKKDDKCIIN